MVLRNGKIPRCGGAGNQRQLDPDKRSSWRFTPRPCNAKHRGLLRTAAAVIATNRQTAQWAQQPIATCQPHAPFRPLVLGPDEVGRLDSEGRARLTCHSRCCQPSPRQRSAAVKSMRRMRCARYRSVTGTDTAIWFYSRLLRGLVDDRQLTLLQEMIKMLNPWADANPHAVGTRSPQRRRR